MKEEIIMNSTFFSDFIMITSFMPIIFIALLIGLFFIIRQMEKKKINFSKRMIAATLLGLLLGIVIQAVAKFPKDINKIAEWMNNYPRKILNYKTPLEALQEEFNDKSILNKIYKLQEKINCL